MKISDLMLRDVRAEIEFEDEIIIVRNPKGEVRKKLLDYFNNKIINKEESNELETIELLIKELTNIEIDTDDIVFILNTPNSELNRVLFYLNSIMQELIFEVIALKNLEMRMQENTLLEKNTIETISNLENIIKEIKQRKFIEEYGKDVQ